MARWVPTAPPPAPSGGPYCRQACFGFICGAAASGTIQARCARPWSTAIGAYCNRPHRAASVGRHAAAFRRGVVAGRPCKTVVADLPARAHRAASFGGTIRISKRVVRPGAVTPPGATIGCARARGRRGSGLGYLLLVWYFFTDWVGPRCPQQQSLREDSDIPAGAPDPGRRALRLKMNARERGCPLAPPA